ncbi:MAG: hypothetical protein IPK75_17820 [Acidobacteria bacterium]|nr:hypothetical protein [Acidobacteriota bacterium]
MAIDTRQDSAGIVSVLCDAHHTAAYLRQAVEARDAAHADALPFARTAVAIKDTSNA